MGSMLPVFSLQYTHQTPESTGESSQMSVLNFGAKEKRTRKKNKERDKTKRELKDPPTFTIPFYPTQFPSSNSTERLAPSHSPSYIPPSTPVETSRPVPSRLDTNSIGTFPLTNGRRSHFDAVLNHDDTVIPHDNFSWSPATPGLLSSIEYDSLSSPESVLSTPQSTTFKWRTPKMGIEDFEKPPHIRRAEEGLKALHTLGISPFQLLDTVLDPSNTSFENYQKKFFRHDSTHIPRLLTRIFDHTIGHQLFMQWLPENFVRDEFCCRISQQMEAAKPVFRMNTENFSAEFLEQYDLQKDVATYAEKHLCDWMSALRAATGSTESEKKGVDIDIGHLAMTCQAMNLRSLQCSQLQYILGMYSWSTGASRQMVETLGAVGLSISHPTIMKTIGIVADHSVALARALSFLSHIMTWDNIDMAGSEHVEQHKDAVSKVRSGCFPMIYEAANVKNRNHMLLQPILDNLYKAVPLSINDIQPTRIQMESYRHQTIINVIQPLTRRIPAFEHLKSRSKLQYQPRRPLPPNLRTKFYALRTTTIEEKSVQGNLDNQENFYVHQMGRDPMDPELSKYAIISINDQLTNARTRGCILAREGDINNWKRRVVFQVGIAIFHMLMNLIWGLRLKYYGIREAPGSLLYFFTLMEKKRLAGEKPNYYALLAALMQILDGYLLSCWITECGCSSLEEFAKSNPSPEALVEMASTIYHKYCTPMQDPRKESSIDPEHVSKKVPQPHEPLPPTSTSTSKSKEKSKAKEGSGTGPDDPCHRNIRLLIRDLLVVAEVVEAVSSGDFGRIEDLFPILASMFRSVGSNKYAVEIITLLYNLKYIWTPEFANIMRDNHLVNISGLPNHFMPIDMNIEHHIGYVKNLYSAKGIYADWEHLSNVSAAVVHAQACKKKVAKMMNTSYKKKTTSDVDTNSLVWDVVRAVLRERLLEYNVERQTDKSCNRIMDDGFEKLKSSVASFNKRTKSQWGDALDHEDEEDDTLPPMAWGPIDDNE